MTLWNRFRPKCHIKQIKGKRGFHISLSVNILLSPLTLLEDICLVSIELFSLSLPSLGKILSVVYLLFMLRLQPAEGWQSEKKSRNTCWCIQAERWNTELEEEREGMAHLVPFLEDSGRQELRRLGKQYGSTACVLLVFASTYYLCLLECNKCGLLFFLPRKGWVIFARRIVGEVSWWDLTVSVLLLAASLVASAQRGCLKMALAVNRLVRYGTVNHLSYQPISQANSFIGWSDNIRFESQLSKLKPKTKKKIYQREANSKGNKVFVYLNVR